MSDERGALTRAELAQVLKDELGISRREAYDLVGSLFEEITAGLERNDAVKLQRLGTFDTRDKTERPGRNLLTGESATIDARRVVTFRASSILKTRISDYAGPGIE